MKIHELIKILESHPNPEAEINIIGNVVNEEDNEEDFDCNFEVLRTDDFYEDFIEIFVMPTNPLPNIISMHIPQKDRGNFLNTDKTIAISSYGDAFQVGEDVGHEANDEVATIESFSFDIDSNEVLVQTNLGSAHLDFLEKLNQ
jgi:hypothetical protein